MNWRTCAVELARLWIRSDQRVEVARLELVRVMREHFDVADAVVACRRLEHARMKDQRRECRVAAGAPASDDEPPGIGLPLRDQVSRRVHRVFDINDAPLAIQTLSIGAAVPGTP